MSRPIDISSPGRAHRPVRRQDSDEFPSEDGPYFGFIEVFPTGHVSWSVSAGSGRFIQVSRRRRLPRFAFVLEKDQVSKTITVEITSLTLRQAVYRAILNHAPEPGSVQLDFDSLLRYYDVLDARVAFLEMRQPHSQDTAEMRLLIRDLLLDKAVYEGIGMEVFRQRGIWPETLVQRIHQRSIEAGLDEIEDCFVLGLIPEPMNRDYMEALNARYADMARSGDLSGLQNLCEPIVRSGEITLQYNPSLLLEVLDNGHIELYQYMLELVDRTRDLSMELLDSQLSVMDITFDPFHVAIRLGQKDLVKALVGQGEFFEGRITWPDSTQILTPLSSAVFWRQADIVRLLLHSGPVYRSGYPQAVSLALSAEMDDMLQVLTSYDLVSVPSSLPTVSVSSPTGLSPAIASTPEAPTLVSEESSPIISGIANSFAGLDIEMPIAPTQSPPWEAIDPVLLQYPPAQGQANVPAMIPTHDNPPSAPPPVEPPMPVPENPSPSTTPEDHHPYVRQRPLHKARRKLGQGFIQRLGVLRTKMGQACAEDAAIQPLAHHFRSLEAIWEGGIEVFRNITRNKVPSGLVQVLHCLMVADALSSHANPDQDLKTQFTNDLGRWRAIFQEPDRNLYDIVAGHLWGYNTDSDPHIPTCSCDQVYQFQELIQNLVSLDRIDDQLHRASKLSGVGLRHIQRGIAQRARGVSPYFNQTRAALRQNQDFPSISHVLGQLTKDTDSGDTGDVDIGDFIHLEAIQEEDARQRRHEVPLAAHKPWKDISSMLVLLLASVAFSIILAVISGLEKDFQSHPMTTVSQMPPGYARSCAVVKDFLEFKPPHTSSPYATTDATVPFSVPSTSLLPLMKASSQQARKQATQQQLLAPSLSASQRSSGISTSPSGSSFLSTDLSSTDTAARSRSSVRCLSHRCPKSFSSVSNRNKHMREGCAFRDKKGYPCRNNLCTKVLTTKWYRKTHEQTRCRFR